MNRSAINVQPIKQSISHAKLVSISLMLFSLFFGAGNLIFPPILGADSGTAFGAAMFGFLLGAVVFPGLALIALALTGNSIADLAAKGGRWFGRIFTVGTLIFAGAVYALPRLGAVAYEIAILPVLDQNNLAARLAFNLVFFGIALMLSWLPGMIPKTLGRVLTPLLTLFLIVLIVGAALRFEWSPNAPVGDYAQNAFSTGLIESYQTADFLSAMLFGVVLTGALREMVGDRHILRYVALTSTVALTLLGAIYVGLGYLGSVASIASSNPTSGAEILSTLATETFGSVGTFLLGTIVLLACITTCVGVLSAIAQVFVGYFPKSSYKGWISLLALTSVVLATQGLEQVLVIAGPIVGTLFPPASCLIILIPTFHVVNWAPRANWSLKLPVWVSTLVVLFELTNTLLGELPLSHVVLSLPGAAIGFAWLIPAVVALLIGIALDLVLKSPEELVNKEAQMDESFTNTKQSSARSQTPAREETYARGATTGTDKRDSSSELTVEATE